MGTGTGWGRWTRQEVLPSLSVVRLTLVPVLYLVVDFLPDNRVPDFGVSLCNFLADPLNSKEGDFFRVVVEQVLTVKVDEKVVQHLSDPTVATGGEHQVVTGGCFVVHAAIVTGAYPHVKEKKKKILFVFLDMGRWRAYNGRMIPMSQYLDHIKLETEASIHLSRVVIFLRMLERRAKLGEWEAKRISELIEESEKMRWALLDLEPPE